MEGPPFPFFFKKKTFVVGDGEFGSFFLFFFFLFGDDGHFGDITKLAIEDTKKSKERKKGKNHCYYYYLTGVYIRNVVYTEVL
jgi:hypothetical protein